MGPCLLAGTRAAAHGPTRKMPCSIFYLWPSGPLKLFPSAAETDMPTQVLQSLTIITSATYKFTLYVPDKTPHHLGFSLLSAFRALKVSLAP